MKKVVYIIESLNLGGAETSLVTFLINLDYSKYEVDLILFTEENFFINYLPKEVNVIIIDFPKINIINRIKYKCQRIFNFKKSHSAQILWKLIDSKLKVFEKDYDIAHAYNQGFSTYYTSKFIKSKKKLAWINIDYQKVKYKIQFDFPFYTKYDKVIAISNKVKQGFEEELNKINKTVDIETIKLFADEKILEQKSSENLPIKFDKNKINIVTTCRLSKQKGLHLAIESCRKLINKGYEIHWYVVGEGEERGNLEKLIRKNKISNHFTLLGKTTNPFPYMKACDIYVQTSIFEGWGLTVIEALLLRKLVVSTNFPTAYDIIVNNMTGLISEMESDDIVRNIERYILDEDFTESIKENLLKRKNFDKEESLNKLEEIIISL
ncbi:glycosyltransferase [Lutibacter sp.]|uniref:glycosyltransferase n=1 Tax=Lutibacter sp. TaxID=1925666 RepID=UPI001A27674D|nr:glycosyltransferase [Lutibacter sp.]MBI9041548.1 glycosyltransferase [Lutibacter sp.]